MVSRVCENVGCDSNTFIIHMDGPNLILKCSKCGTIRLEEELKNWKLYTKCKTCGREKYKLKYDDKDDKLKLFCANCNQPPAGTDTDDDGNVFKNLRDKRLFEMNKKLDEILKAQKETHSKLRDIEAELEYLRYSIKD